MRRSRACLAAFAFAAVATTALGGEPMKGGVPYRVAIDSDLKVTSGGAAPILIRAQAEFDYRLAREADVVQVAVDRMTLTATLNGREASHTEMSRTGILSRQAGKETKAGRGGANPRLAALLDQFEAPLAVFTVDPEGDEVRRELKSDVGPMITPDIVGNTRIFHPRFPRDKDKWDARARFPLGQGQKAQGMLHYTKRQGQRPDGRVEVDVSGRLEVSGKMGKAEIKKGDYVVKGVQTYDPKLGDWSSGELTVDMEFEGVTETGDVVKGKGPVVMKLTRLGAGGAEDRAKASP